MSHPTQAAPTALLTGATGLLGRWLLPELTVRGHRVLCLLRDSSGRGEELRSWVQAHGGHPDQVELADFDLCATDLGLSDETRKRIECVRDVFHLAALFGFGLAPERARRANVTGSLELLELVSELPTLRRFVHVSGYRTTGRAWAGFDPDDEARLAQSYRRHGAYETSKMEAHVLMSRRAESLGVPLSTISPAAVIGDSRTGETTQVGGLGEVVEKLRLGRLPALAGSSETFMPVVPVDFVAQVMARVPEHEGTVGQNLVVLDDSTPDLPDLVKLLADRLEVRPPRLSVPAGVLRVLPRWLTGVDREALSFISEDRYDSQPLRAFMGASGLELPALVPSLDRWVDHLVATDFLRASSLGQQRQ